MTVALLLSASAKQLRVASMRIAMLIRASLTEGSNNGRPGSMIARIGTVGRLQVLNLKPAPRLRSGLKARMETDEPSRRKDMRWIIIGFAIVIVVTIAGALSRWH